MQRNAKAVWKGGKDGEGHLTTHSKAIENVRYTFGQRFQDAPGTNPEELMAAAHAGCFSMALTANLGGQNITPETIETKGTITLEKQESGFTITKSHLDVNIRVPGGDRDKITSAAEAAKDGCPVSRSLSLPVTMELNIDT